MSASRPFDYRVPAIAGCALFMELLDATAVLTALQNQPGVWGDFKLNANEMRQGDPQAVLVDWP